MNCCLWFGFTAGFVLVASRGDPVSFNTTVGVVLLKDIHLTYWYVLGRNG